MRHIMVATDGSKGADRALDFAMEMAKGLGARLSVLTVAGDLPADEMKKLHSAEGDVWGALDSMSRQILRHATERARQIGVSITKSHAAWGDPAEAIIDAIGRDSVDMVVVGRRGRGQLAGLLMGSVSQKVVTLAPCVVIVVP